MQMINIKQASSSSSDLWQLRPLNFEKLYLVCLVLMLFWPQLLLAAPSNEPPFELPAKNALNHVRSALIKTERGDIVVELFPQEAPWHVANFKYLADRHFYDGLSVSHAFEGHLVEAGDPRQKGRRPLSYALPAEFNSHKNRRGALGMASQVAEKNPERLSDPSIFHILIADNPRMDGRYTVFGEVTAGMSVVDALRSSDLIKSITVFIRP